MAPENWVKKTILKSIVSGSATSIELKFAAIINIPNLPTTQTSVKFRDFSVGAILTYQHGNFTQGFFQAPLGAVNKNISYRFFFFKFLFYNGDMSHRNVISAGQGGGVSFVSVAFMQLLYNLNSKPNFCLPLRITKAIL